MSAEKRACPSCGEPVYPSDDLCMSCGADLHGAGSSTQKPPSQAPDARQQPSGADAAAAPVSAGRPRAPVTKPWYHKPVEACGRLWDIYPWIGIGIYVVGGLVFAPGMPEVLRYIVLGISLLWHSLFLFWLIVDVLYFGVDWWWVAIAFICCYPFGLLLYLWKGR